MKILSLALLTTLACNSSQESLTTVKYVDLDKYAGKWYEIASYPNSFQKGCHCSTAEYKYNPKGYIEVINTCRKNSVNGEIKSIKGKAFIVKDSNNAKLKVQFFWPFKGDYWIIGLADDYSYAIVGNPSRKYLWILSRTPVISDETYSQILEIIRSKGYDTDKIVKTAQKCN